MNSKLIISSIRNLIKGLGEDEKREGLIGTPERVLKMYEELLCNVEKSESELIKELVFFNDKSETAVKIKNIRVSSFCEHHLIPFIGTVDIEYYPKDNKVLGLSKFSRIVDFFAKRPQIQERLTNQIGHFIIDNCHAEYVDVKMTCEHLCMSIRGVLQPNTVTETNFVMQIPQE